MAPDSQRSQPLEMSAVAALESSWKKRSSAALPHDSRRRLSLYMARSLDNYIGVLGTKGSVEGLRRTMSYFVTSSPDEITPVERMALIYETLPAPDRGTQVNTHRLAINYHAALLAVRALDQHHENPERYVSHGFDHSIRVADYMVDLAQQPQLRVLEAVCAKYGISFGEALFAHQLHGLSHDTGYPFLLHRPKAFHGIPAADMLNRNEMRGLHSALFTSMADKHARELGILLDDMRDAILYHGADKIEGEFAAQIETSGGRLLLKDPKDIFAAVLQLCYLSEEGMPYREVPIITARDSYALKELFLAYDSARQIKPVKKPIFPLFEIAEGSPFKGRNISLGFLEDPHLGIEYRSADMARDPFLAVLRIADNMDAASDRLTGVQRELAFQAICKALGDNGPLSQKLQELEARARTGNDTDSRVVIAFKEIIIDSIFARPEYVVQMKDNPELAVKIKDIALGQNSQSLPHFAGCQVIDQVRPDGTGVIVTVNRALYEKLNKIEVEEHSLEADGRLIPVRVKVGDYQIWRMQQAFESVKINGQSPQVRVEYS